MPGTVPRLKKNITSTYAPKRVAMPGRILISQLGIVARRMHAAREAAGLSIFDVAARMQQHSTTISSWERGTARPSLIGVIEYAHAIGVQPSELFP